MDPNFGFAHNQLGQAYIEKGMYEDAIGELQKAIELSGGCPTCTANLARAYVATGRREDALVLLNDLQKSSGIGHSHDSEIAVVYAALGDNDQAMIWLDKGSQERFNPGVLLRPGLNPLRSDARFQSLVHRIGLK
jgi:Flp pilus assembly protein TadD